MNDGDWSVLVMDPGSTKLMSAVCRVSEILNFGVARAPRALSPARCYPNPSANSDIRTASCRTCFGSMCGSGRCPSHADYTLPGVHHS